MNKKITLIVIILIVILFSAMAGLFLTIFEQRESERDIGFKGEAAFNPLLIAQRFLENTGIDSESVVSMLKLKEMPAQKDILLLATRRFDIGPVLRDKIINWVDSGGHLIIIAWPQRDTDSELQDPILEELGISVSQEHSTSEIGEDLLCENKIGKDNLNNENTSNKNDKSQKNENEKNKSSNNLCDDLEYQPVAVTIVKDREKSKVAFDPSIWLTQNNDSKTNWTINGENGAHVLEFVKQKGLITVLSDYNFLTNEQFHKFDHAAFFWYLVHYSNSSGKVWIVYKGDMPPLYNWLSKNLWAPFLTLFFIIFIWIWSVLTRFGSLYPESATHRRNLIEHIRASGQFLWKNKFSHGLISETRNALQEKITKRHPNWKKLTDSELYIRLAKQSGLSVENIEFSFITQNTSKEKEFFLIIQTLERLRKSI